MSLERRRRRPMQPEGVPAVPAQDPAPQGSGLVSPEVARAHARVAEINGEEPPKPRPAKLIGGMTAEESLRRAQEREAEIMEHDIGTEEDDKFYVPQDSIPSGWKYAWRRVSTYLKEDPQYLVRIAQTGWNAVPAERHPEMMPSTGGPYHTIDRDGMRLFEIPERVHKLLEAKEHRKALDQVRVKQQQLTQAPAGHFERANKGQSLTTVKHGYEPLIVPDA